MYTFCYKVLSPGGKYRTDFRYLIVDIRYFSVLWIPTSVSVYRYFKISDIGSVFRYTDPILLRICWISLESTLHVGLLNVWVHLCTASALHVLPCRRCSLWVHVTTVWRDILWKSLPKLKISGRTTVLPSSAVFFHRTYRGAKYLISPNTTVRDDVKYSLRNRSQDACDRSISRP